MLNSFFYPVETIKKSYNQYEVGSRILKNEKQFPDIEDGFLVLIGLGDHANFIREALYKLKWHFGPYKVVDLGNIKHNGTDNNIHAGLKEVLVQMNEYEVDIIILGSESDYSLAVYDAAIEQHLQVSVSCVSPAPNIKENGVFHQLMYHKNRAKKISIFGTQEYYMPAHAYTLFKENQCEHLRLGMLRANPAEAEPSMRDSQILLADMSTVRMSDAPKSKMPGPNGLHAEELCQLFNYAGLSTQLNVLYFYGFNFLSEEQTALVAAQSVWYFIKSRCKLIIEEPTIGDQNYLIYRNKFPGHDEEIVFYKSKNTERWWFAIEKHGKIEFVSCSYQDYIKVSNDEVPDRWIAAMV